MKRKLKLMIWCSVLQVALLSLSVGCATYSGFTKQVHVLIADNANNPIPDAEVEISWRHGNPLWPKVAHESFLTDKDGRVDQTFWSGSFHYVRMVRKPGYTLDYGLSPIFEVPPEQQKSSKEKPIVIVLRKKE